MSNENPFLGPKSYDDQDIIFGRDSEIAEVYNLIRSETLTLIFARSGTGKSSLLKAGLIPFLRKDYEYFPIYIHLNDSVVTNKIHNLNDFIIKNCISELNEKLKKIQGISIKVGVKFQIDSLFEFLSTLKISQNTEDNLGKEIEYTIKPLLIFDQFEEIFTQSFTKSNLPYLINDLSCLLDSKVPSYLEETFNSPTNIDDESCLLIKNSLLNKQKAFRILFSFREEFLPQIESLTNNIPAIRFTNSRFRLEPFSMETAEEVIHSIDTNIGNNIAREIARNLAIQAAANFEKVIVEPFLLSLVCQKIYPSIIMQTDQISDTTIRKIKSLVVNALEDYISDVYENINVETQSFIEEKLITSDNKRTLYNYLDAVNDDSLKNDIDVLIANSQLRLLNKEKFLDSEHIEILHDRLLPPLSKRRDERLKRTEEAAQAARVLRLEEEARIIKQKYIEDARQKTEKLEREKADHERIQKLKKSKLRRNYIIITTVVALVICLSGIRKINNQNKSLSNSLKKQEDILLFFKMQSDSLVNNIIKQNPLSALALSASNYENVKAIGVANQGIVNAYKGAFTNLYNNNMFFTKDGHSIGGLVKSSNNDYIIATSYRSPSVYLLKIVNQKLVLLDSLVNSKNVIYSKSGFEVKFNYVYNKIELGDQDSITVWNISNGAFAKVPLIFKVNYPNERPQLAAKSSYKPVFITNEKSILAGYVNKELDFHGVCYSLKSTKRSKFDVHLNSEEENIVAYDLKSETFISTKTDSQDVKHYRIYNRYGSKKIFALDTIKYVYYWKDGLICMLSTQNNTLLEFRNLQGSVIDKVILPKYSNTTNALVSENRVIAFDQNNQIVIISKEFGKWKQKFLSTLKNPGKKSYGIHYYSFSKGGEKFATTYNRNSIAIIDMKEYRLINSATFQEPISNNPIFVQMNRLKVILSYTTLYTLYYDKPKFMAKNELDVEQGLKMLLKDDIGKYYKEQDKYRSLNGVKSR
jgi:hypothetical protein